MVPTIVESLLLKICIASQDSNLPFVLGSASDPTEGEQNASPNLSLVCPGWPVEVMVSPSISEPWLRQFPCACRPWFRKRTVRVTMEDLLPSIKRFLRRSGHCNICRMSSGAVRRRPSLSPMVQYHHHHSSAPVYDALGSNILLAIIISERGQGISQELESTTV